MKKLSPLIMLAFLTACGGGGNDTPAPNPVPTPPPPVTPVPVPAPTLSLSSPTIRTIAGGSAIPLSATLSTGGAIRWKLADGAPGTLSADSGATVRYLPPAGALAASTMVPVTASGDGASATLTLNVTPDPGKPGLYHVPWRADENDPTMHEPRRIGTDHAGNIYVVVQVIVTPTRMGPAKLIKIAPDGTFTTLIGETWFGKPNPDQWSSFTSNFVIDRAGNFYYTTGAPYYTQFYPGLATTYGSTIEKMTPTGEISIVAGIREAQIRSFTDGTGSAARFVDPIIAGIDFDGNIYMRDNGTTIRKVTPAGVVTTVPELPASLNADMNGNRYHYDGIARKLMRTSPAGAQSEETSVPHCPIPYSGEDWPRKCIDWTFNILPVSGSSYVMINGVGISRMVLPH